MRQVEGDVRLPKPGDDWARVADVGGTVAGFSRVDHWAEADGTRLYLLSGCIDPAWRRRGLGRALLAHQEAQAAAHWREHPGPGRALLGGNADETRPENVALLLAAGYRVRFTLVDLARDPAGATDPDQVRHPAGRTNPNPVHDPASKTNRAAALDPVLATNSDSAHKTNPDPGRNPAPATNPDQAHDPAPATNPDLTHNPADKTNPDLPPGLTLRPVREDHHPRIHQALEACFADSGHGQHERTYQDYLDDVRDVDLWLIAWDGDDVAAVIINERHKDGTVDTPWVAVVPAWRRRGVARALLQRNLRLLADQGVPTAKIRTVQENTNHTVALYESVGYRVTARHPRYAKPL